ncbi:hypothetical protein F503_08532 [Ophiostoma piceae UAMH 11346]|uniref:Uncharacterized protein n=1 Tax=Ophiostoma piceae (strain UAMH 11346) TaxID=1262450 RepID=S3BNJ8_OPHP1|nr:hypothetical protein F503_08532 [Ophiostoma piceae UAMH 11346]
MSILADIQVPQISRDELFTFHESHFAKVSVADFGVSFTGLQVPSAPVSTDQTGQVDGIGDEEYYEYEYEEGEGEYGAADDYDDEPFDPSVAHLVPDFEVVEPTKEAEETRGDIKDRKDNKDEEEQDDAEEGEIPDEGGDVEGNGEDEPRLKKKKKRRRKKNGASNANKAAGSNTASAGSSNDAAADQKPDKRGRQDRHHGRPPKPDLRKRTWDVVDQGLGSLDYDETETDPGSMPAPPQRRRIQYED